MRVGLRSKLFLGFIVGLMPLVPRAASAHPMGNFAICHYSRIETTPKGTRIHYIIDFAEIPTVEEMRRLDPNHDGTVTKSEEDQYLLQKAMELNKGLALTKNGKPVALQITARHLRRIPGAAGLETLVVDLDLTATGTISANSDFKYVDNNYPSRTGWKEIVIAGANGIALTNSSAPTVDLSSGLTKYPTDIPAPNVVGATFSAKISGISSNSSYPISTPVRAETVSRTPQDSFTQVISQKALSPALVLIGLVTAFFFGAMHALSPGHGKAMVAAYLVGSKGTAKHAVVLGLLVTVTHTLGVILLGLGTLLASKYVVPERLYPILTIISGTAVCCVGLWSLKQRLFSTTGDHHHHDHSTDHFHSDDHDHAHDHDHDHNHDHGHSHGDGHYHSHVPEGPITMRSMVALGVSGGLIPCPSALVVLLAAVALHRIAYGMALLVTFSLGLASVLVAIGILVVKARTWLDSLPARPQWQQTAFKFAPALSSVFVTLIGFALILQAVSQVSP